MAKPPISDEELQLRKRARRRLVGAVVLVLLVVVFVPMFLDREPRQQKQDMDIQIPPIPGQTQASTSQPQQAPAAGPPSAPGDSSAASNAASAAPGPTVETALVQPSGSKPSPAPEPVAPAAAVAEPPSSLSMNPAEAKPVDAKPVEATQSSGNSASGEAYVIRLGAFADSERAKDLLAKLKSAKVPGYTEPIKTPQGVRTRVRAGPFSTMQAAEKAKEHLKVAKLTPGGDAKIVRKGE